jgi:hypothetical protein
MCSTSGSTKHLHLSRESKVGAVGGKGGGENILEAGVGTEVRADVGTVGADVGTVGADVGTVGAEGRAVLSGMNVTVVFGADVSSTGEARTETRTTAPATRIHKNKQTVKHRHLEFIRFELAVSLEGAFTCCETAVGCISTAMGCAVTKGVALLAGSGAPVGGGMGGTKTVIGL